MASFRDVLQDLFSRKLVITRQSGRLKVIDFNKDQAANDPYNSYKRIRKSYGTGSGYSTYNGTESVETLRLSLYNDYELMDSDPTIASALDIYADECTAENSTGEIIEIKTDDENIRKILYNLFNDILNIEFNLWHWVRGLCKHGDIFLVVDSADGVGVFDIVPIYPAFIRRVDDYCVNTNDTPRTVYVYEGDGFRRLSKSVFEEYEVLHMRLISDTNFLPYGKSVIEGARKAFKQLTLMEDAMLLHRIMRAPERRVFKIDVGNIAPDEVDSHIEEIVAANKKTPYIDPATGQYNLEFNVQNMLEDYYLPVRGDKSGTDISTLDGLKNDGAIDDIEYIKNRMISYLKIPKAYLNYDETTSGKAILAGEDIRFAKTISRIQKVIVGELYKIAFIHLKSQGFSDAELISFELSLTSPSLIYERQKIDLLNEKMGLIKEMLETKLVSRNYIYENILNMTDDQKAQEKLNVIEDAKEIFRLTQIENEGNDPKKTGKSFGTSHDLAAMSWGVNNDKSHPAESDSDARHNNTGRPEEPGTINTRGDVNGEDPIGEKGYTEIADKNVSSLWDKDEDFDTQINAENIEMLNEEYIQKFID